MASKAYIVSAFRTAAGKKNGRLSRWHPVDLGAAVVNQILKTTKIDGALVDDG
jgi:acetyl-CoA C-acetyltransferase